MMRRPLAGALVGLALVLTACGGGTDEGAAPSPTISLPASAMSSTPPGDSGDTGTDLVGGDPSTWSPLLIRKQTKAITLVPGEVGIFPAYDYSRNPRFVAVSSDPQVVIVLDPKKDSFVGIRAVAPGTAVIKVYKGTEAGGQGKYLRKVKVTVTE